MARLFIDSLEKLKIYSKFCSNNSQAQKARVCYGKAPVTPTQIVSNERNEAMRDFFAARNPSKQMSTAFESYLIKPVQRVLKYPLILRELKCQCRACAADR